MLILRVEVQQKAPKFLLANISVRYARDLYIFFIKINIYGTKVSKEYLFNFEDKVTGVCDTADAAH